MTNDQTEAVAHRWHLEMVREGKRELAEQILAPGVTIHAKQLAAALKAAFPISSLPTSRR